MPLRPSTKTLQDLILDIRRTFGDESGVQLDNTDITRWANNAQQEIVNSNKALKAKSTTPTVVGQGEYLFPSISIQQIESLHYDNAPLIPVEFAQAEQEIFRADPARTEQGTPIYWYEWDGVLTIWPLPDSVKNLTLYYTAYPDVLTGTTTQLLGVPDKFYNAVVDYCLMKAYEMDEDQAASQMAEQRFRAALEAQMEEERLAQNMTYPVILDTWNYGYGS